MRSISKRFLPVFLSFILVLSLIPAAFSADSVVFSEGFESGNKLVQNGDAVFEVSGDFASEGSKSLKVSPGSGANYHGVALAPDASGLAAGGTYKLTAKAYSEAEASVTVRVEETNSAGKTEYEYKLVNAALPAGKWADIVLDFDIPEGSVVKIAFINGDMLKDLTFYLDDIKIADAAADGADTAPAEAPAEEETPAETPEETSAPEETPAASTPAPLPSVTPEPAPEPAKKGDVTSLKDLYASYFMFGNVMDPAQTDDAAIAEDFKFHYNVVTAENAMKPTYLSPSQNQFNFESADKLVNWALSNGIAVHGHTLIWHSQSSAWLHGTSKSALTRAEAQANMKTYIDTVAGHYSGKVISWDVVNEVLAESISSYSANISWKQMLRKDSPWYLSYANGSDASKGEDPSDYIYDAFVFTRLADPGATLYYNDYNETMKGKREYMAEMAEELNARWKTDPRNTEPGRLLVEGLGMQAHYWTSDLSVDAVDATLARFIKAGVEVSITELDIPGGAYGNYLTTEDAKQAKLYAQLFEVFKKHADGIKRVTIWGKIDSQSWRRQGNPLLFDGNGKPKAAYFAAADPKSFLVTHWTNPFSDVAQWQWFHNDVAYANSIGLMAGTGNQFNPNGNIRWDEFLVILYRLDGNTGVTTGSKWSEAALKWASENGLTGSETNFTQLLTRQDLALIIDKYLEYSGRELFATRESNTFADEASISAESKVSVDRLYRIDIINGMPENMFEPQGNTTRAQFAAIISRLLSAIQYANTAK